MSDSWICIIPEQPRYAPTEQQVADASAYLNRIAPDAEKVVSDLSDFVIFHDCGGNFERVMCPGCGSEISMETWQDWMEQDFDGIGFRLSKFSMPCCRAEASLHELRYELDQGFGRFELTAMNPNLGELPDEARMELEKKLGCHVRVIYRHI